MLLLFLAVTLVPIVLAVVLNAGIVAGNVCRSGRHEKHKSTTIRLTEFNQGPTGKANHRA